MDCLQGFITFMDHIRGPYISKVTSYQSPIPIEVILKEMGKIRCYLTTANHSQSQDGRASFRVQWSSFVLVAAFLQAML